MEATVSILERKGHGQTMVREAKQREPEKTTNGSPRKDGQKRIRVLTTLPVERG